MNALAQSDRSMTHMALIKEVAGKLAVQHKQIGAPFAQALLGRVADSELSSRPADDWAALATHLLGFMRERRAGQARVLVHKPESDGQGGENLFTAISILTDDMPFLVDSVTMAVRAENLDIHTLLHPVLGVRRDAGGNLLGLGEGGAAESLMYLEIDRLADASEVMRLQAAIESALADVRAAVADWAAMRERMLEIAAQLPRQPGMDTASVGEAQEFLRWVAADNFTLLGYREYEVTTEGGDEVLRAIAHSGLGILRERERSHAPRSLKSLVASGLPQSGAPQTVILTKTNARATVHRAGYMDYIGVLRFDAKGKPVAEQRFLGLFTSSAYTARPQEIPLVRQRVSAILERSGLRRDAHLGKALRHILETMPRDELFQASTEELAATAMGVLGLAERARPRLFLRADRYARFYSCLIYLPRERFSEGVRERLEHMLRDSLRGDRIDSQVLVDESPLARLYAVVRPRAGAHVQIDVAALEQAVAALSRNWHDDLREVLIHRHGEEKGLRLANRFGRLLPTDYIEDVGAELAADDVQHLAGLRDADDAAITLYRVGGSGALRFKIIHFGAPVPLSDALPMLENLGVRISAEHLLELEMHGTPVTIHDFDLAEPVGLAFPVASVAAPFAEAFAATWRGQAENDGFNRLVLGARLEWRQVAVLRGYCKYLLQVGLPYSQPYMEEVIGRYPLIAGLLIELFLARFDPRREQHDAAAQAQFKIELEALADAGLRQRNPALIEDLVQAMALPRAEQVARIERALKAALDDVQSLDDDRILRLFLGVVRATLRTGYFQRPGGAMREYINYKFDCARVPELPKPRPFREIFVYSPRVEGIHLRFGPVARGGLRWSDRREDFRTEVLGLVKAQMVKNTVIVPVGSKGGFFVKRPPVGGDREAQLAEGIACYRLFVNALLDITDNIIEGAIVPPADVVRHDGDDPYLVVAADKGTATFSDIANSISIEHDYWLGDAFASGGSNGYDHKRMAITARGGWESVKRHFRALGRDCQREDFTCVGVGDLSGDVFGNAMLQSRHIRLLAAFDHRDIFLDPNPDAARSFVEHERMFKLPRSSWQDYDKSTISKGGGIWPRSAKSIPISPEVRAALGIGDEVEHMAPTDLLRAILKAPVDLLWNGGIGTYVKASSESNADAGDRANNAIRLNGNELRCKIIGEGGNLGLTQRGRIEAAFHGVQMNTDFIDNSAGVDTSDHEVNIKILLNDAVQRGELDEAARNRLLPGMTDEIARLVLWDNYRQNQAISLMEHMAVKRLGSFGHLIRTLEAEGTLDRAIEFLPSDTELAERRTRGLGLTRPELAILLSYDKIKIYQQLLDSDVPEDAYLSRELQRYFPEPLHGPYAAHMQRHRLKREIIATAVTNTLVNRMGASFMLRMQEDTGQGAAAIAKAFTIAREVLLARELWAEIEALDGTVTDAVQIDAVLAVWELVRSLTRWLLNRPGAALDIAAQVERYAAGFAEVRTAIPQSLPEPGRKAHDELVRRWLQAGLPRPLAEQLAALPTLGLALDVVEVAHDSGQAIARVAHTFFELGAALELDWMRTRIEELPVESRWHAQARGALRDELAHQHRQLAVQVLGSGLGVEAWLGRDDAGLRYTLTMLGEIRALPLDYPIASVAVRRLAQLAQAGVA